MHAAKISREELLGWLGGQYQPVIKKMTPIEIGRIAPQDIVLAWREKPANCDISALVIVRSESLRDFYAFVGTYISTYTPFSAFFRVATPERLFASLAGDERSTSPLPLAAIGVAIAEAFVQARGKAKSLSDLSIPAVLGTMSATLAAAVYRGYQPEQLEEIGHLWSRARQLSSDDGLILSPAKTIQAWHIIAQAYWPEQMIIDETSDSGQIIASFLRTTRFNNGTIAEQLYPLTARFPALGESALRMRGTREDRVRVLSDVVRELTNSSGDILLKEFLAGSLLSLLGNGSFEYLPFAANLTSDLPGAALWFGMSSALQRGTDALTVANCLGRRAARDAFGPWSIFETPRDDISIEELEVSRRSNHERSVLRGAGQSILSIELVPGVSAKVRSGSGSQSDTQAPLPIANRRNTKDLNELQYLIERARHHVNRLAAESEQPDMFDPDNRPSRRRR